MYLKCGPCQRRGCASLCPDGSLVSKGSRYILSDTETLHRKIEELTLRVRDLEKGLEQEHALHSQETHPLLKEPFLSLAAPPTQEDHKAEAEDGPISAFGTLMIADDGTRMKWLGSTAVAAWFLENEEEEAYNSQSVQDPALYDGLLNLCNSFPFGTAPVDECAKQELYKYIPVDEPEAMACVNRFFLNVGWLYNFVPKKRLETLVENLYDPNCQRPSPHRLAIFYMVMALGTLVEPNPPETELSSNTYCQLARAALGVETIFGANATLATVQALSLLALWYQLSDESDDPSKSWGCLGLTYKVAQSIGLHRDNKIWNLSEEEARDRRRVFWELQSLDTWQALGYGRPPSLVRPHFDCPQPFDTEDSLGHPPHFHRWKHHYIAEGVMNILDKALIPHSQHSVSPPHAIILKLDTKVRSCAIPAKLQMKDANARGQADDMLLLQHYTSMLSKESCLMYLHRGFFARAVFDPPHDPLRHKFAHSVLAAYTSACQILKWLREVVLSYHHILSRIFGWWGHAYSSTVTLGGLVAMAPGCNLAEQALKEFDMALETLQKGDLGRRARRILPALEKLQQKAHKNIQLHRSGQWKPESRRMPPPPEMSGLGTARLRLSNKPTHNAHSLSPNDSSASGSEVDSQRNLNNMPHSCVMQAAIPSQVPMENGLCPLNSSMQGSAASLGSETVSPQDLMYPAAPSNGSQFPTTSVYGSEDGRPYSRAQSFDDFLRLHRLQDRTMTTLTSSAPLKTAGLPSYSHSIYSDPQPIAQPDSEMYSQDFPWDSQQFGQSHFRFPTFSTSSEFTAGEGINLSTTTQIPCMEEVHFTSVCHGDEPMLYDTRAYSSNQDISWQIFMNDLGL